MSRLSIGWYSLCVYIQFGQCFRCDIASDVSGWLSYSLRSGIFTTIEKKDLDENWRAKIFDEPKDLQKSNAVLIPDPAIGSSPIDIEQLTPLLTDLASHLECFSMELKALLDAIRKHLITTHVAPAFLEMERHMELLDFQSSRQALGKLADALRIPLDDVKDTWNANQPKILIVDDEPTNIMLLGEILCDYAIIVSLNGSQALEIAQSKNPPDLILLDIIMPDMNGYEVCEKLKSEPRTKDIPVIFILAANDETDETDGLKLGAIDYITKPFSNAIITTRIKNHLSLQRCSTELKKSNKRLEAMLATQQQNIQLLNLNKNKNQYIGIVAHDLCSPLGSVLNCAEIMLKDIDVITIDEQKDILNLIIIASNEMITMVNNLLDCNAIERGYLKLKKQESCLANLINHRIHICHYRADLKHIKISQQLEYTQILMIDENRIAQVLDNLLVNAIKFSESNTEIRVTSKLKHANIVVISIQDQGPGIPASEIDNIFGEFTTTANNPTNSEKTTGLGLAIVKKIINEHHGQITVESELGKGTTFHILLPINPNNADLP